MDILIKGMEMPSEGRIINLTICSDGSVINNLPDAGGKMSSYRSERVKAAALPSHGDLVEISKVKEALCIHGQASPWDSYVPVILGATE